MSCRLVSLAMSSFIWVLVSTVYSLAFPSTDLLTVPSDCSPTYRSFSQCPPLLFSALQFPPYSSLFSLCPFQLSILQSYLTKAGKWLQNSDTGENALPASPVSPSITELRPHNTVHSRDHKVFGYRRIALRCGGGRKGPFSELQHYSQLTEYYS